MIEISCILLYKWGQHALDPTPTPVPWNGLVFVQFSIRVNTNELSSISATKNQTLSNSFNTTLPLVLRRSPRTYTWRLAKDINRPRGSACRLVLPLAPPPPGSQRIWFWLWSAAGLKTAGILVRTFFACWQSRVYIFIQSAATSNCPNVTSKCN